jgi:hypothetical protein
MDMLDVPHIAVRCRSNNKRRRRYRPPRFRRAAPLRAVTAAQLYISRTIPTVEKVAVACGSNKDRHLFSGRVP